jgi:alpha-N-arabinofuranosidase
MPSLALPAQGSRIEVLLNEKLGTISPNIYGQFIEHLGGVIYDGVWVGENSSVPNINGIRKALVEKLRRIKMPVVRWPGGCFADSYDWKDGIGERSKRSKRTNFWAGAREWRPGMDGTAQKYEINQFGTDEFLQFCRLTGSQPYLAANLRSLPAQEFSRWVEYCNSPAGSTTLAEMRAAAGQRDPYGVRYWGVGNESWGCGGNFTPEEYAAEYRRFVTWVPSYGKDLSFIPSGGNDDDFGWTRRFLQKLVEKGVGHISTVYGLSVHHYAWNLSRGKTNDWEAGKGDALSFEPVDWYELLREGSRMVDIIDGHWRALGEYDAQHQIRLIVDEWGAWYRPGTEVHSTHLLGQQSTMRDAVMSALTLDIFNRHPEKVAMANCAQLINCLNSLFLAHEHRFMTTPVYHVYEMYAPHQGADALRTIFSAPSVSYVRDAKPASFWGLNGSASIRDKQVTVTVVNPDVSAPRETEIVVVGAGADSGTVTTLAHSDIHAHNTFASPETVSLQNQELKVAGGTARHTFPPASVTRITLNVK